MISGVYGMNGQIGYLARSLNKTRKFLLRDMTIDLELDRKTFNFH